MLEVEREHAREKREREIELLEQHDHERETAFLKEVDLMVQRGLEEGKISK